MKKHREFKMKKNYPKWRVEYAGMCKTVRNCVTGDIRKVDCNISKKVLESYKGLKSAKRKMYVGRRSIFALKRGTTSKIKNEIVHIVKKANYNDLYKCRSQKEINFRHLLMVQ